MRRVCRRSLSDLKSLKKGSLNFINGQRTEGSGKTFDVFEPRTGDVLCRIKSTSQSELDDALSIAKSAQLEWMQTSALERADVLHRAASLLEK